jgi:hypothetical protein
MSRFLNLPNRKTPATAEDTTATREDAFANSVATLRKATGTTEARVVPGRCADTGQRFSLRFERLSPAHRFQIVLIDKDEDTGGQVKPGVGLSVRRPPQSSYDASEFDWTGLQCPHCGDRSGLVYCNQCRETVCRGRVRSLPDGEQAFACHDGCGATGSIGPPKTCPAGPAIETPCHRQGSSPGRQEHLICRHALHTPGCRVQRCGRIRR